MTRTNQQITLLGLGALFAATGLPILANRDLSATVIAASLVLAAALVLLSAIDAATMRLPDLLTLPLTAAGILACLAVDPAAMIWHVAGAVAGYALLAIVARGYLRLRKQHGLGLGDAKLLAAAGAWVGLQGLPSVLLYAATSLCRNQRHRHNTDRDGCRPAGQPDDGDSIRALPRLRHLAGLAAWAVCVTDRGMALAVMQPALLRT